MTLCSHIACFVEIPAGDSGMDSGVGSSPDSVPYWPYDLGKLFSLSLGFSFFI